MSKTIQAAWLDRAYEADGAASSPGAGLAAHRAWARERVRAAGWPTTRDEGWRHTPLTRLVGQDFEPAPAGRSIEPPEVGAGPADVVDLVLLDGVYRPELSQGLDRLDGVVLRPLAAALEGDTALLDRLARRGSEDHSLVDVHDMFLGPGLVVEVPPGGGEAALPLLRVTHWSSTGGAPRLACPTCVIDVAEGAHLRVVQSFRALGSGVAWCNDRLTARVAAGATLDIVRLEAPDGPTYLTARAAVELDRDSRAQLQVVSLGGELVRNDLSLHFLGAGGWGRLDGLYLKRAGQLVDNHTTIEHGAESCESHELFKGILDDDGTAVFRGRIIVRPGAQKTDSKQTNNNLLLSRQAAIHTRPQLEIYADDVKCTHGATIGRLDEDALFYLRSRGLSAGQATSLMTYAFAGEVIGLIGLDEVRPELRRSVLDWLPQSQGIDHDMGE